MVPGTGRPCGTPQTQPLLFLAELLLEREGEILNNKYKMNSLVTIMNKEKGKEKEKVLREWVTC